MATLDRAPGELWKGQKPPKSVGYSIVSWRGTTYIRRTVTKRGAPRTELHKAWVEAFQLDTERAKRPDPCAMNFAQLAAPGTGWFARDIILTALNGKLFRRHGHKRVTTPTTSVYRTAAEGLSSGVFKILTPNAKNWDNNVFWNPTSNPSRITVRSAGVYLFLMEIEYPAGGTFNVNQTVLLNGVTGIAHTVLEFSPSYPPILQTVGVWYLDANDYIEAQCVVSAAGKSAFLHNFTVLAITPETVI